MRHDILAKYAPLAARRAALEGLESNPFAVRIDQILSPTEALVAGRRTILLGTNNYLGLTFDPGAIDASAEAVRQFGTGTTGSRIANGTYGLHQELEAEFARFLKRRSAMVFSTGYQANLAMIAGLAGPKDLIVVDADSHASIYDGCKLSAATTVRFRHNDAADLDRRLARLAGQHEAVLVIVEGIYSMFGDTAPLRELAEAKDRHGAWLMVDEAHSFGCYGATGRGVGEAQGIEDQIDFVVGTFSKSLGAIGGFAAGDHPELDLLRICARPYMFTASPSPATCASVLATLRRIAAEPALCLRVQENGRALHEGLSGLGLELAAEPGPIVAVKLPDERSAVGAWSRLLASGVYVNLAVPPGTPGGTCLLRCSVSAAHTPQQITTAVERFGQALAA